MKAIDSPTAHRPHRLFRNACTLFGVLLALFVSGCGRADRPELRIAINPWPGYDFLFLAKEKGFLTEEGVNVRLVQYPSLSDCRVAFESGQVDAMACTLVEVLQARENSGRYLEVAWVADYSNGADVILGRKDVTSVAALKGRRVGLELGSLGVFMLARAMERAGLKLSDVEMVSCAPDDMPAAIANGTVDAVVTFPPTSVRVEAGGHVRQLFSSAEIPGEVVDVVAVDAAWLQRDPGLPAHLARAMQRAVDEARAHPQEAYTFLGQREQLSGEQFSQALSGVYLVGADEQNAFLGPQGSLQHSLRSVERTLRETGQLKSPVTAATGDQADRP